MSRRLALLLAVLAFVGTGLMAVAPGEAAVVYRLGAVYRTQASGLGFRLPWPVEWEERIDVETIRRVELKRTRLLTGDTNLIDLELVVQYQVSDPVSYLTRIEEPEALVSSLVGAIAAEEVSRMAVDSLLTNGRSGLQQAVKQAGQVQLDRLGVGVQIASIEVRELIPPSVVVDAFNDVSSAQGDQETLALAADAYASEVGPKVRGRKVRTIEEARAASAERMALAEAEVGRFNALRIQARKSPESIRVELRNQLLEDLDGRVRVIGVGRNAEIRLPLSP